MYCLPSRSIDADKFSNTFIYKGNALIDVTSKQFENENDETVSVSRVTYTELKRELQEKKEIICTLNHKITYLEDSMKLKDLRISNLSAQIPQNAMNRRTDRSAKSQLNDGSKLRS